MNKMELQSILESNAKISLYKMVMSKYRSAQNVPLVVKLKTAKPSELQQVPEVLPVTHLSRESSSGKVIFFLL